MAESVIVRVVHLNTASTWRGGERQVFNLAIELKALGIEQLIVARKNSELARKCKAEDLNVRELPMRGEWDIFSARKLAMIVNEFEANILHAHTGKAHSIGLLACRKLARPIIFLVSRRVDFPMRLNFFSKKKYFHKYISGYIAISKNIKNVLVNDGIDEKKIDIAYSGIDLSIWQEHRNPIGLRSEFMLHHETLIIGNVAALVDHKDHGTLLDAIAYLEESDKSRALPSYRVLILGDGELRISLEKKAKQLGLIYPQGPVIFCGYREDIYEFYYLFDIFLMSSKEEGLGTAVLDAMAAALPVCSTNAGGIPEMIAANQGGLLSNVGDARTMALNLEKLILSNDLRNRFGAFNKKQVQKFSHKNTANSNLQIYQKHLERAN